MKPREVFMTPGEYGEHVRAGDSFCSTCREVTRYGDAEFDSEKLACPECGEETCMGMEAAVMSGLVLVR